MEVLLNLSRLLEGGYDFLDADKRNPDLSDREKTNAFYLCNEASVCSEALRDLYNKIKEGNYTIDEQELRKRIADIMAIFLCKALSLPCVGTNVYGVWYGPLLKL